MTAATGSRLAGRAATTRTALLGSARTVFTSSGFAEASIAEVVAGAGRASGPSTKRNRAIGVRTGSLERSGDLRR